MIRLWIFAVLTSLCNGAGFVEISLTSYSNLEGRLADGTCCGLGTESSPCPGHCNMFMSVCLQAYRPEGDQFDADTCPYGSATLETLDEKAFVKGTVASESDAATTAAIPFRFSWPGATTLILELKHLERHTSRERLIARSHRHLRLDSSSAWQMVHTSTKSRLSLNYRVRLRCQRHFYGPACDRVCKPRDDFIGHYNCTSAGEKACLDGWQGEHCNQPLCQQHCGNGICAAPNTCRCRHGWQGANCDECVRYEGCVHGYCNKAFECICQQRWGGHLCDLDMDYCKHRKPCHHPEAICVPHAPNNYTCLCPHGFTGRDCQIKLNSCDVNPCVNGGSCVVTGRQGNDYKCICHRGHHGPHCEYDKSTDTHIDHPRFLGARPAADISASTTAAQTVPVGEQSDSCFYKGHIYPHGSRWDTLEDCRQCSCLHGVVNCSSAACQQADCLQSTCPKDQVCESVTNDVCLKAPCLLPYGQCKPWHLLDNSGTTTNCDQSKSSQRCASIFIKLDDQRLPQGTTVGKVCYQTLLVLLTRRMDQYELNCRLVYYKSAIVVRIDMRPLKANWPIRGVKSLLFDLLRHNMTASPILQSVSATANQMQGKIGSKLGHHHGKTEKQDEQQSWLAISAVLALPVALFCLILALLALIFALKRRLGRQEERGHKEETQTAPVYAVEACVFPPPPPYSPRSDEQIENVRNLEAERAKVSGNKSVAIAEYDVSATNGDCFTWNQLRCYGSGRRISRGSAVANWRSSVCQVTRPVDTASNRNSWHHLPMEAARNSNPNLRISVAQSTTVTPLPVDRVAQIEVSI